MKRASGAGKPLPDAALATSMVDLDGQTLHVGHRAGTNGRPPLLLFNGIGANLELAEPFITAMEGYEVIIFDVPGVGQSPNPAFPYRPGTLAALAAKLLDRLGHGRADVLGVSWGGGLAQEFAHKHPQMCRRLVLAATSAGSIMVPGSAKVLWKMASPRRYTDKGYMRQIAADIYGGAFRRDPELIKAHARNMRGSNDIGYGLQLLAMLGWTSLPWLHTLGQPTLVLAGNDDPLVPVVNARLLASLIPHARLEILEDGHLFVVTTPRETARLVDTFLRERD